MANRIEDPSIALVEKRPARSPLYPWYDSVWLAKYARARAVIRKVRPEALTAFVDALRVFHTRSDFQVRLLDRVFDDHTLGEIRRIRASLRPADLELQEARMFGRFVVHNHPFFTELQRRIVPAVSEAVGEPVEVAYNFLSLYSARGVCPVHMDSPEAKWTLDLCIDQSEPWPIYLSQVLPWPEPEAEMWADEDWENRVKQSSSVHFTPYSLQPGQALVFSGSGQWHYREAIPGTNGRQFCDLLFLHFIPKGTAELVRPQNWARLFGAPELDDEAWEAGLTRSSPAGTLRG